MRRTRTSGATIGTGRARTAGSGPYGIGARAVRALAASIFGAGLWIAPPAAPAVAQVGVGAGLTIASPRGEFGRLVDRGTGAMGHVSVPLAAGLLGLRVDGGILTHGSADPLGSALPGVDADANPLSPMRHIAMIGVGPQLSVPLGPFHPYAYALAGLSYFWTEYATDEHFDEPLGLELGPSGASHDPLGLAAVDSDVVPAVAYGGGVTVPLGGPVRLDLGVQWRDHATTDALPERGADLLLYRAGISIGL